MTGAGYQFVTELSDLLGEGSNQLDATIGQRIRLRRHMVGLSQAKLAELIGVTFQQVQKYEKGTNRIGLGRLADISRALGVKLDYFTRHLVDEKDIFTEKEEAPYNAESSEELYHLDRKTIHLIRAFNQIKNPDLRNQIFQLVLSIAQTDGTPQGEK